jgi:hypothetical protein
MTPSRKSPRSPKAGPDFTRDNYLILAVGLLFIVIGFVFLGFGDITISPILLVLGYCVIIPLGILFPERKGKQEEPAHGKTGSSA